MRDGWDDPGQSSEIYKVTTEHETNGVQIDSLQYSGDVISFQY